MSYRIRGCLPRTSTNSAAITVVFSINMKFVLSGV